MDWWNSTDGTARVIRRAKIAAAVLLVIGGAAIPFGWTVSLPTIFVGMACVLGWMFAWFRLEHLRELERPRSR
jgi:hypothetical protein